MIPNNNYESTLKSFFATNYTNYTNLTCYYSAVYETINTTNYQKHRFWSGLNYHRLITKKANPDTKVYRFSYCSNKK